MARKPKWRMRTKPRGSRWSRKRRRNASAGKLISFFLLPCAESRQRKGYDVIVQRHEPVVGDSDTMGVGAEVAQRVFWAAEGTLGVLGPIVAEEGSQPCT